MTSVNLTKHLPAERREHVEARLHSNLMAWLTTVRPDGQPDSVPVWFLVRDDESILAPPFDTQAVLAPWWMKE